jgi:hypothetical protein
MTNLLLLKIWKHYLRFEVHSTIQLSVTWLLCSWTPKGYFIVVVEGRAISQGKQAENRHVSLSSILIPFQRSVCVCVCVWGGGQGDLFPHCYPCFMVWTRHGEPHPIQLQDKLHLFLCG